MINWEEYEREFQEQEKKKLGEYIGKCPRCSRQRFCECADGYGRCEKCGFEMNLEDYGEA